jgi:hypothetical protein
LARSLACFGRPNAIGFDAVRAATIGSRVSDSGHWKTSLSPVTPTPAMPTSCPASLSATRQIERLTPAFRASHSRLVCALRARSS